MITFKHRFSGTLSRHGDIKFDITDVEVWSANTRNNGGVTIRYDSEIGFGEVQLFIDKDGNPIVETETYGKDFAKAALSALVDAAILRD